MSGSRYEMTWGRALGRSASKFPWKVAIRDHSKSLTYEQLDKRTNRLANALFGLGLRPGDRMATLSPNRTELVEFYFACLKIGVIPCPIDTRLTLHEQLTLLELVWPCGIAFSPDWSERALELGERMALVPRVSLSESPTSGSDSIGSLVQRGSEILSFNEVTGNNVAFILFTGGTTGIPKGVELTHLNLIWNAMNVISENRSPSPESVICYPMQIYHSGALSRLLATIFAGGTFIALPKFDPAEFLDTLEKYGGDFVVGNQAIWRMLLEENRTRPRRLSVRSWLHAQGPLSEELENEIREGLFIGADMYVSYALTEASPGVTILKPSDCPKKRLSIGRPYMTVEVRLVDEEDRPIPTGATGEILVRGPNVMKGYFRNPEATSQALKGGWLHTGDLAYQDELGYFYFAGRKKEMIKSGGLNIYPREIEEVIETHPAVSEVAVVGIPHSKWGESIVAVIVPKEGTALSEEEIINHCRARLASYKKPSWVVFLKELPKDSFGSKVKKDRLRELVTDMLAEVR